MIKVKDTNLINLRVGDILMYRAGSLFGPDWDFLGGLIKTLEGNTGTSRNAEAKGYSAGDYTHCAWVRTLPDPEAEVEEVSDRPGVYKVKDGATWLVPLVMPGHWVEEPQIIVEHLASKMGTRIHATYPCVREDSVDWENPHMEVWRMRRATPEIIRGIIRLADDMKGWQYDLGSFLTFGNLLLPGAKICSEFIADIAYNASILLGDAYPICLTADIQGNGEKQTVPNEIINSEECFKVKYQGLLGS